MPEQARLPRLLGATGEDGEAAEPETAAGADPEAPGGSALERLDRVCQV